MSSFAGFAKGACAWFDGLEAQNEKAWFEANRAFWDSGVRAPIEALLAEAAAARGGRVKMFRQNRDVRFSKDKSPYKTSTYGAIMPETGAAGFYAAISREGFYAGGGYYDMTKDQLERFRAAVADEPGAAFATMVARLREAGADMRGRALKTAPRGFAKDHERIELLRLKEVVIGARLAPAAAEDGLRPATHAADIWDRAGPAFDWLDAHVGPSRMDPEERFRRR